MVVWGQQDQFVRIEGQDGDSVLVAANDHPARLSANLIRKVLGSLEVQFEGEDNPVPVFSNSELEILGEAVSRGLAQAGPSEDITCVIAGNHRGRTTPDISTYRLFFASDRLNLIVGTLHGQSAEVSDGSGHSPIVPSRKYIPSEQRQTATGWAIVPRVGMKYKTSGALASNVVKRYDWLILDPTPDTFREAAQMWEDTDKFQAEQQDIQQRIEAMQRSIEQIEQSSASFAPVDAPAEAGTVEGGSIKQRLEILRDLKNEGLITEEEFSSKKRAILDSF
ncbi:MAG: SHOCT domain-containing protein [Syntrophotaleaceae bacterium]